MFTALIMIIIAAVALVLILLAVVVVAIRQEARDTEMSNVAPSLIAVMVRRLLGVSVRRPTPPADPTGKRNGQRACDQSPHDARQTREGENHCRHTPSSK
jgi:hypothetical protein